MHIKSTMLTRILYITLIAMNVHASDQELSLHETLNKVWTDHGVWMYGAISADLSNLGNTQLVTNRLMQNQADIEKALVPYYGKAISSNLGKLLKDHILITKDYIASSKAANAAKIKDADKRWHKNTQDISAFLSKTNKFWIKQDVSAMFDEHLEHLAALVKARLKKDWAQDIKLYDDMRDQLLSLAKMLADGIVDQFPTKF